MANISVLEVTKLDHILGLLDLRDAALWIRSPFANAVSTEALVNVVGLPWNIVISEVADDDFIVTLERAEPVDSPLVLRRGFIQIVDGDPRDAILPQRSLPVLLLNGRHATPQRGVAALARRLNMLQELGRRSIKQLVILAGPSPEAPNELDDLWSDGFRTAVNVVSDSQEAQTAWSGWQERTHAPTIGLYRANSETFCRELFTRFIESRGDCLFIRIRSVDGKHHRINVTGLDDPERPLLGQYEFLAERELSLLMPSDLTSEDVERFFKDVTLSWRPFAAGMPWERCHNAWPTVQRILRRLDKDERNNEIDTRSFFVRAESGAGATTFVRSIAFIAASEGYPTLVAGVPLFSPNATDVVQFLTRVTEHVKAEELDSNSTRLYEAPYVIIFDRVHWEGRENELVNFVRELERSGRRAVVIVVTGPYSNPVLEGNPRFRLLAEMTHEVSLDDALNLGRHLNRFLTPHGTIRSESDWRNFFQASAIQASRGIASFWIALSFWVQRQFDMGETVQAWLYRRFREAVNDPLLARAIIRVAALSTERQPLPDELLPETVDWPVTDRLSDLQREIAPLGLVRVRAERGRYWAMIHDLLGRYLLTALFYDSHSREEYGFAQAKNPEHLRFLALRELSQQKALERRTLRGVAESFAVTIFKIDPDHGRSTLAPFWREVLDALDEMPRTLRISSRAFLHHTAISRRRIAADSGQFEMTADERAELLRRAVNDIEFALTISDAGDGDSDLNLYNSLAHAFHDLAEAEKKRGANCNLVQSLQTKAREWTRRAYALNPDNSFVIETFARDLLAEARSDEDVAATNAIEVLNIVYAAMGRDSAERRRYALGRLADEAFEILLNSTEWENLDRAPDSEPEAIARALGALRAGVIGNAGIGLDEYPPENRVRAAKMLAHPMLLGNIQAVKLHYTLTSLDSPKDFALQLELLQELSGNPIALSPQMRLEYAVLLHQRDRHHEADQQFRELRRLWSREEHYVEVPDRLRWLLTEDRSTRRQVNAKVAMTGDSRYRANVREFNGLSVVFRPHDFPRDSLRAGSLIRGYISFGHNGPFLRPLTQA